MRLSLSLDGEFREGGRINAAAQAGEKFMVEGASHICKSISCKVGKRSGLIYDVVKSYNLPTLLSTLFKIEMLPS